MHKHQWGHSKICLVCIYLCFCLYTGPLNNPGLNCMGPVTHRFLAMVRTSAPRDLSAGWSHGCRGLTVKSSSHFPLCGSLVPHNLCAVQKKENGHWKGEGIFLDVWILICSPNKYRLLHDKYPVLDYWNYNWYYVKMIFHMWMAKLA